MKHFFRDMRRYSRYSLYACRAALHAEVAGSYLGALWWVLDPLLFMLIYTFITGAVFSAAEENMPVFVFIGLSVWEVFNTTVLGSVRLVRTNRELLSHYYLPKFTLLLVRELGALFKLGIKLALILLLMALYNIRLTAAAWAFLPVVGVLAVFSFGCGCVLMHLGVFITDLYNVVNALLRLTFYLSGAFYSISGRLNGAAGVWLLYGNPLALLIHSARLALMYGRFPCWAALGGWLAAGVLLSALGVGLIYRYENSYLRVLG